MAIFTIAGTAVSPSDAHAATAAPENAYDLTIDPAKSTVHVVATVVASKGDLYMAPGVRPDSRSAYVSGLRAVSADGKTLAVQYQPAAGLWHVDGAESVPIGLSYDVDLTYLRRLPHWARLQVGFTEGRDTYLVTKGLFVVPDSLRSNAPGLVRIHVPRTMSVVTPWTRVTASTFLYRATLHSLANNTIVVGNPSVVRFHAGALDIDVVCFGGMARYEHAIRAVAVKSLRAYTALFPGTPRARYIFTAVLGDEDGQAFDDSGAISTEPPMVSANKPIWANTIAHELFHFWNGRRIERNDERLTLFTEGFTEYYANRTLLLTGVIDAPTYWTMAANHLGAYSYFWYSPNFGVPLIEAGLRKTKNRFGVYDGGWTLALCIDLELRNESHGQRSADDLMRAMWTQFGLPRKRYSYSDLLRTLTAVAGHDYGPFFARYVVGGDELPYRRDLATIGLQAYTETFGGKTYLAVAPQNRAQRLAYAAFVARTAFGAHPVPR